MNKVKTIGQTITLIAAIAALVFAVNCYVSQNLKNTPQISEEEVYDTTAPEPDAAHEVSESECNDEFFKNEKLGIEFYCPDGWLVITVDNEEGFYIDSVTLRSPDFKQMEGNWGISSGFASVAGTEIVIVIEQIDTLQSSYTSVESILNDTADEGKGYYFDVEATKIAGINGVSYRRPYGDSHTLISEFEYAGKQYSIYFERSDLRPNFNRQLGVYQHFVDTFQLFSE